MTLFPGLVSVTFRQLSVQDIVNLTARAGLDAIEWGGDVHVPHGDLNAARAARVATEHAGLRVAAYGSYYRVATQIPAPSRTCSLRRWNWARPVSASGPAARERTLPSEAYWDQVVADIRRLAYLAHAGGVDIVLEFHRNTLTDTTESTVRLLELVNHPSVYSYWQPPRGSHLDDNLAALDVLAPWLYGLHVFAWHETTGKRLPLDGRAGNWQQYLQRANALNRDMFALLEFVEDDNPATFLRDAQTLTNLLPEIA